MLALMVDLEDDEDWSFSDDVEDTDMDRYLRDFFNFQYFSNVLLMYFKM